MDYLRAILMVLVFIQPARTSIAISKGFQCFFYDSPSMSPREKWRENTNVSPGMNVVFLVHNKQDTRQIDINLTRSIIEGIVDYVREKTTNIFNGGDYSLGFATFTRRVSVGFPLGFWAKTSPYNDVMKHAEDFLKEVRKVSYEQFGTNISAALAAPQHFFYIHRGNRIFAPNLCVLLTTAPPDNQSLAMASAKDLQDIGVSIIVIALGEDVNEEDVKDLASNRNVVFTARLPVNDSATDQIREYTANVTHSIPVALARASVLPRFSMCYQTYIDFCLIIDISRNYVEMISQLADFIIQFNLRRVKMRIMIIDSPVTDETFVDKYKQITNRGIVIEAHGTRHDIRSGMAAIREYFAQEDQERNVVENILIVVSDKKYAEIDDVTSESRACKNTGIHVMALGVGKDASQEQLAKIISDPTGIYMVTRTEDIFWGLQSLNRKLCPAVCDRGWRLHNDTCYYYRDIAGKSWLDAKKECGAFNGRLVCITSRDTSDWLTSTFSREFFPIYIGLRKYGQGNAPIYSDMRWENGKPLLFTNWSTDGEVPEPDGGMYEACVAWYPDGWRDVGCSISTGSGGWLCEREAGNTSKPHMNGVTVRPLWTENVCHWPYKTLFEGIIATKGDNCRPVLDVYASTAFPAHAYNCSNGELISKYLLCDGVNHCRDGSDEVGCASKCDENQFQCDNSNCVSLAFVCDFSNDCGDGSDEEHCVHPQCDSGKWTCVNGQCIDSFRHCDLDYDCYDKSDETQCGDTCRQTRCYDGTCVPDNWIKDGQVDCGGARKEDEIELLKKGDLCYNGAYREVYYLFANKKYISVRPNCSMVFDGFGKHYDSYTDENCRGSTVCPIGFYKCPASYCIPLERVCDGIMDCVDGEDEIGCSEYICPGYFRCPGAGYCLHPSRLCNGEVDCPGGKDEVMCDFHCPQYCTCIGGLVTCENLKRNISRLHHSTRKLVLWKQLTAFQGDLLNGLHYLAEAALVDAGLETVVGIFKDQANLQRLNISRNKIITIPDHSLAQLENLKILDLSFNKIESISEKSFSGLSNLRKLHMRSSLLRVLHKRSFSPLVNLQFIDLRGSGIQELQVGVFTGLVKLQLLQMNDNDIEYFNEGIFDGLQRVKEIHTDVFTLCCPQVRPASVKESQCFSRKDSISSCDDLMANDFLRASIWILCISSLIGNVLSTGMRILWEKSSMKIGFGVFVTHLGISDFLMGVYLLIIAIADTQYRGVYIWEDHRWRVSYYCKIAGFLATLSSEASAMFIFLITLDRFLVMKFPFGRVRFRFKSATVLSIIAWILAFVLSGIPLLPSIDHWEFYSKNGACLALPFFTEREPGWVYSVIIFMGFNFVVFILIALGQYSIYRTMKQSSMISTKERMAEEMAVARGLLFIVLTDFFCWFPVGVMGLLALSGTTIGGEVYAWTAVFVLPVNSALNPFLYTIPAVLQKLRTDDVQARICKENTTRLAHMKSVTPGMPIKGETHHLSSSEKN